MKVVTDKSFAAAGTEGEVGDDLGQDLAHYQIQFLHGTARDRLYCPDRTLGKGRFVVFSQSINGG